MVIDAHQSNFLFSESAVDGFSLKPAPGVPIILCWSHEYRLFRPAPKVDEARPIIKHIQVPSCSCIFNETGTLVQSPLFYRVASMRDVELNTQLTSTHMIYRALRAYFDNGGDYCYVVNQNEQAQAVACLPAASLIVEAGTWADVHAYCDRSIFTMLDSNIIDEVGLSVNKTSNSMSPHNVRYALCGPWLKANWSDDAIPPSAAVAGFYCQAKRNRVVLTFPLILDLQSGLAPLFVSSDYNCADYSGYDAVCIIQEANSTHTLSKKAFGLDLRGPLRGPLLRWMSALKSIFGRSWIRRRNTPIPSECDG